MAYDGTQIWVANHNNYSVTELDATTGLRVIRGPGYGFDEPTAISSDGTDVWVADPGDQSITEFPA